MFAYLAQKVQASHAGAENQPVPCTTVAWNKENNLLISGHLDGMAVLRNMDIKSRTATGASSGRLGKSNEIIGQTDDQDLVSHQLEIRTIAWNSKHDVVATGDTGGIVTVWRLEEATGIWLNFMATRAVQVSVSGMKWTEDGECICIVYENGSVMVGKIDGMKLWSVEQKHAKIPAWSPDGTILLIGSSLGQIFVYDKTSNNIGLVSLTKKLDEKPSEKPLVAMQWYSPASWTEATVASTPGLAVAFEDGKCFLLHGENDPSPTVLQVPLKVTCLDWSADGRLLAVGGRSRKSVGKSESNAQLIIYSALGRQEYTIRFQSKTLSAVSWDSTGRRLAVVLDGVLTFYNLKHPCKFCFFENILVYACAKEDNPDSLLVLYNCKTERKVTIKHYPGQRLVCLTAGSDFCVATTRVTQETDQYNVYIVNDTGATANVTSSSIEPLFVAANANQVIVASREVIFVWSFRQSGGMEIASSRWENNERYFHVDDAHGFIDIKLKRQRIFDVSVDPIYALTCSKDVLIVARESGNIVRYSLPQMSWEREYSAILARPRKLGLNTDSSRLLLMNHEGQCCMYVLAETKLAKDAVPVKDVKLNLERHDIWDFLWAEDDAELFVVAQRNSAVVYRNRDPEEPVANEGYFCQFKNLEIRVAFVDDIVRSATPTEPPNRSTKVLRVKSLRETYHLIETASLAEAQRFVDTHPHPILWNLIADKALHQLQLDLAEVCYIHGENYRGTQLIGRLRKQKSDQVRRAEVSAHFGEIYRAEQEFTDGNRIDLAYDMRRISGDWFRLKEMAEEAQNDAALRSSYEGLGKYYFDRQSWSEAVKHYDLARDYAALYQCHMINGDVGQLEELAEILPTGHHLLVDIGQLLGRYGNSKAAAKILRKADRPELAIRTCLDNYDFQAAADIARSVDVEGYTPSAVTTLMKDAIKEQIANQDGTKSLWDASNLYYNAGSFLEAAQCLFQILSIESEAKQPDYIRLKKISVLAASAVEESQKEPELKRLGNKRGGLDADEKGESSQYTLFDDPWHAAEAYNLIIVAQTFHIEGNYPKALRAAGTLSLYMDVIDPVQIFSMIALTSVSMKRWDMVNEALMRLVNMDTTSKAVIEEMEGFADELFTKFSPNDVDKDAPLPSPLCMKCKERIPIWDIRCQGCAIKYPLCMATGSPVTEMEVWQCDFCHHHCAASAIVSRKVCPLCHAKRK